MVAVGEALASWDSDAWTVALAAPPAPKATVRATHGGLRLLRLNGCGGSKA